MGEDQNLKRDDEGRPASSSRSPLTALRDYMRGTLRNFRRSIRERPTEDELERLSDLHWQISDSALQYRDLLEAQAGLIVRRDAAGHVIFANRAYLAAFGLREEDIAGRRHEPRVLAREGSTCGTRIVEQVETVDGPRWIDWEVTSSFTSVGAEETQRTGRDVTEERRRNDELRRARDAALEASRAKSRFLATISHEIRTPMNGILGMSDLLLDGPLTADQTTFARTISQSARVLMTLIDEILDFSRIEAGKLQLNPAPFSITDTVESCIALIAPRAADKGLTLGWRIEGAAPPFLLGDEARVRQILLNLLSNAVKFTDSGGVRVALSACGGEGERAPVLVRLEVEDTGIGLTAAECEEVFAEFERTDAALRRQDGGSGLGLAIARRIARAMQGDITVMSEPGRGATFTAEVHVERADENVAALRAALHRANSSEGRPSATTDPQRAPRVLVVEDNAVNALLATRLLEREGCSVVRAHTGDEAVTAVARSLAASDDRFDLILMDIYMPRLDGIEATRAIRRLIASSGAAQRPPLPIIAVTANAFAEDRHRYLAAGMDDYLVKPFDARALGSILARWLPGRQAHPAA